MAVNKDDLVQIEIGKRLKILRNFRAISQKELATKFGCKQAYISEIEKGKRPLPLATLLKITGILDIDLAAFDIRHPLSLPGQTTEKSLLEKARIDEASLKFLVTIARNVAIKLYRAYHNDFGLAEERAYIFTLEEIIRNIRG